MPTKLDDLTPVELTLFIKHLKYTRGQRGLSQRAIAETAGLTKQYISTLENENNTIGIDSMGWIAQALEIPLYRMLNPLLIRKYETFSAEWEQYQPLIDNSIDAPFERLLLSGNFKEARLAQGYLQKDVIEQTRIAKVFLIHFEKGITGIGLNNALKLSRFLMIPLVDLLTPKDIKTKY
jgi:transcriptional regulator with XRE-family HTH domain